MAVTVLGTILVTLLIVGVVIGLGQVFRQRAAARQKELQLWADAIESARALNNTLLEDLKARSESVNLSVESFKAIPILVEGMKRIAAEQVIQINGLRTEVANFRKLISRGEPSGVQVPTDEEKGYFYEAQRMMAENPGMTRDEAVQRIIEEMSKIGTGEFSLG